MANAAVTASYGNELYDILFGYAFKYSGVPESGDGRRITEIYPATNPNRYKADASDSKTYQINTGWTKLGVNRAGFLQLCRTLIERHKEYPVMARKGMIEGTVVIRGTLAQAGVLRQCIIFRSSGSGLLDNAALRAVRNVDRFPQLPSELQDSELVFELPISFRLSAE